MWLGLIKLCRCSEQGPGSVPDWLYVAALWLYFVIGGIAWTMFIWNGITVPDSFITLLATIAGGLVGVLAPTRGPGRPSQGEQDRRPGE